LPRTLAEFELEHQVVIAIALVRDQSAKPVAGDVEHAIGDAENFAWVIAIGVFQPRVAVAKCFAVEQANDVGLRRDGVALLGLGAFISGERGRMQSYQQT